MVIRRLLKLGKWALVSISAQSCLWLHAQEIRPNQDLKVCPKYPNKLFHLYIRYKELKTLICGHLFHWYGKNKELRFFRLRSKMTETRGDALQDWGHFEKEQCFFSLPHANPWCRLPRSWSAKLQACCHRAASHIPPAALVLERWLLLSPLWGMLSCNVLSSFIPLKKVSLSLQGLGFYLL